jgi:hypothetical protein
MMPRKPRDLNKKYLLPKNYREFLQKAMRLGRETDRRAEPYSPACLRNQHDMCHGFLPEDWTKPNAGKAPREECVCGCHI